MNPDVIVRRLRYAALLCLLRKAAAWSILTLAPRLVSSSPPYDWAMVSLRRSSRCVTRTLRSRRRMYHNVCRSSNDFWRSSSAVHARPDES